MVSTVLVEIAGVLAGSERVWRIGVGSVVLGVGTRARWLVVQVAG